MAMSAEYTGATAEDDGGGGLSFSWRSLQRSDCGRGKAVGFGLLEAYDTAAAAIVGERKVVR